jgi:ssDNA-binding Zn-finger/Zn-ribbon topoisomerase 1
MKSTNKDLVGMRRCPRCSTPISSFIGRYANIIRQTYRDVEAVKARYYSEKNVLGVTHAMRDKLRKFKLASKKLQIRVEETSNLSRSFS